MSLEEVEELVKNIVAQRKKRCVFLPTYRENGYYYVVKITVADKPY